jgi:hypothetical protein
MSYLDGVQPDAVAGNNPHQRKFVIGVLREIDALKKHVGIDGGQSVDTGATTANLIPPFATFNVQGVDGHWIFTLTNPEDQTAPSPSVRRRWLSENRNQIGRTILHQIQSATDTNFDANSNVTTYGPSDKTSYDETDPNQTKFWRWRSSYDGENWNDWKYFENGIVCGPGTVWSGLMRGSSEVLVNNAATASDGISPISQHGTSTQVDIAAKTWKLGSQTLSYLSGSTDPGGGIYGLRYVYGKDQKRQGGTITYLSSSLVADVTSDDANIYFGKITTAAGGGGTGSGGGSGACPGAGAMLELYNDGQGGTFIDAKDVRQGMQLLALDGGAETVIDDPDLEIQNCFSIELDTGEVLKCCSATHPVRYAQAGFVSAFDLVVSDVIKTKAGVGRVTKISFIGAKVVYHIHLDRTRTYFVDGILAHNVNASQK